MSSYANEALNLAWECMETLDEAEIDSLRASLEASGVDEWNAWAADNREEALQFLCAEPAQRRRKKAWQDPARRARLALAAHRLARLAAVILSTPAAYRGKSYRAAVRIAISHWWLLLDEAKRQEWPFPVECPFPEWEV